MHQRMLFQMLFVVCTLYHTGYMHWYWFSLEKITSLLLQAEVFVINIAEIMYK